MRLSPQTVLMLREYQEDVFDKCFGARRNHRCRSLWLTQEAKSSLCVALSQERTWRSFKDILATKIQYITRKSCTKNASDLPFPNLASMLLSILIANGNRGIPNAVWINIDTNPAIRKYEDSLTVTVTFNKKCSLSLSSSLRSVQPKFCM